VPPFDLKVFSVANVMKSMDFAVPPEKSPPSKTCDKVLGLYVRTGFSGARAAVRLL
jgi:hypothetical protein